MNRKIDVQYFVAWLDGKKLYVRDTDLTQHDYAEIMRVYNASPSRLPEICGRYKFHIFKTNHPNVAK